MQQVVFKVQTTSGNDLDESTFQGLDGPMVVTSGGFKLGFLDQQTVVIPADKIKTRHLEFIFSAYENQMLATGKAEEMKGFQKDLVGQDIYFDSQILMNYFAVHLYRDSLGDQLHRKFYSVFIFIAS
ncbi:hypothetical protein AZE42_12080 [Rhizopogon vesiculosus]|uniref:Uncharacterized protein n=1 Tax=Rhizopogon vesiculosus TaxID=180088 RepID=A0A1J8PGY8_9AGAM|nr:hypothetical protein AZE42_12080 [Rhizopogon vesiculosus]